MDRLELEDNITNEIQVVFDDGNLQVVKEYDCDNILKADFLDILIEYKDLPNTAGIRVIRSVTKYNIVEISFETV